MPTKMSSAAERKRLISDLKFFERESKKLKSKKVIDFSFWISLKDSIKNIKEQLGIKK